MTELEWLKDKSGLTDEELKAMEAVAGHAKFVGMLQKIIASNETALKAKDDAEKQRLDFEKRYNDEFIPEMRKVTQDSLKAQAEAAAAKAQLEKAREYGIVPDPEPKTPAGDPPRAPGSPNPDAVSRDDFGKFQAAQNRTILATQRLSAQHFKLFGDLVEDWQPLVDEVSRQHTLGNKGFTLEQAWEGKYNVPAKREEVSKAAQQKHDDEIRASAIKEERQRMGANPNVRSGAPSRFSTYKPSDSGKEPWKAPRSQGERNRPWRQNAIAKVSEHIAA